MADTVRMVHEQQGKKADVHVDEVAGWKPHGWREMTEQEMAAEKDEATETAGDVDHGEKTVAELREYAATKKIDLGDATKKADILAAIEAAEKDEAK